MRPLTTSAPLESRSAPGPGIARGKLQPATADEYGRRLCPQSDSNRHCADFLSARVGVSGQQKQVASGEHIACTTRYLAIAGTTAVRSGTDANRPWSPASNLRRAQFAIPVRLTR